MKKLLIKCFGVSYRTTLLGWLAILLGLRSGWLLWVPNQSIRFNLLYVEAGPMALLIVGIALLLARDNSTSSDEVRRRKDGKLFIGLLLAGLSLQTARADLISTNMFTTVSTITTTNIILHARDNDASLRKAELAMVVVETTTIKFYHNGQQRTASFISASNYLNLPLELTKLETFFGYDRFTFAVRATNMFSDRNLLGEDWGHYFDKTPDDVRLKLK